MKRRSLLSLATIVISAGLCHAALADTVINPSFIFTLSNPNQSAAPGQNLSFTGTIANTGNTDINLVGMDFTNFGGFASIDPVTNPTCAGTVPCIDLQPFFNNAPFVLSSMTSFTGVFFNVDVPITSMLGSFQGSFFILGNIGSSAIFQSNPILSTTTVTPEPSTWLLMSTGLLGLIVISRRIRLQHVVASPLS